MLDPLLGLERACAAKRRLPVRFIAIGPQHFDEGIFEALTMTDRPRSTKLGEVCDQLRYFLPLKA